MLEFGARSLLRRLDDRIGVLCVRCFFKENCGDWDFEVFLIAGRGMLVFDEFMGVRVALCEFDWILRSVGLGVKVQSLWTSRF